MGDPVRDLIHDLARWQARGVTFALATVVSTSSSAPRSPGACLAVHPDGAVLGSVSGGCVEAAVVATCEEVLAGEPPRLVTYGYSDGDAIEVGLTCGGTVSVFVQAVTPDAGVDMVAVAESVDREIPLAIATVVSAPDDRQLGCHSRVETNVVTGTLDEPGLQDAVVEDARGLLAHGSSRTCTFGPGGERRREDVSVFIHVLSSRPRMLVYGATDFAAGVADIGRFLGFHVTVCDARAVFATPGRFPRADEVVTAWPHRHLASTVVDERTVICVLTHDPKFDEPVLAEALGTSAGFIGVLGSRRTHEDRLARLRARGIDEAALSRLRSPVGLDLGGRTPEETAISIAAEIVGERWGGSGQPLRHCTGPIHARPSVETAHTLSE